jgi:hypothetical protein
MMKSIYLDVRGVRDKICMLQYSSLKQHSNNLKELIFDAKKKAKKNFRKSQGGNSDFFSYQNYFF